MISDITQLIGNTPLIRIKNTKIYAKLEQFNPGGSIKDRTALYLIEEAEKEGRIDRSTTIIEPTAGNTGIGLALIATQKGYKFIAVVPERFSEEKQIIMKALGAKIVHTPTEGGMMGAIAKAKELQNTIPNAYIPEQFSNPANPKAHYETTGPEIRKELGKIDFLIAGMGTAGTIIGAGKYLKEKNPEIKIIAVEPKGSAFTSDKKESHKIEGIGVEKENLSNFIDSSIIERSIVVQDEDAHAAVLELASKHGMLVGSSSGAAFWAAKKIASEHPEKNIVTIFPDAGERYLTKNIYGDFNEWKY